MHQLKPKNLLHVEVKRDYQTINKSIKHHIGTFWFVVTMARVAGEQ